MTLKLKRILLSILCVLLFVCGTLALSFGATTSTFNASAEVIEATMSDVQAMYKLKTKKAFPTQFDTKLNPDDSSSPMINVSNGVIYYPNGIIYNIVENKEFSLDVLGQYKLKYFGENDGRIIVAEKEFIVSDNLYALSATNSSFIDYATEEYMQSKIAAGDYIPKAYSAHSTNDTKLTHGGDEAISVNLEEGTQFIYSEPIDFRNVDSNGLANVLSFEPRAENWAYNNTTGKWELEEVVARKLVIKLTDCYDSSRYVRLVIDTPKSSSNDPYDKVTVTSPNVRVSTDTTTNEWGLWTVSSSETFLQGQEKGKDPGYVWSWGGNKILHYDEGRVVAWTQDQADRWFYGGSLGGYSYNPNYKSSGTITKSYINILFDYENSAFYASAMGSDGFNTKPVCFTDFFNEELYPLSSDSSSASGGLRKFTTGEAYLSISYETYVDNTKPARVDIFKFGDKNVSDLFNQEGFNPELGSEQHKYVDSVAPNLTVDFVETINGGALVAVGDMFTVPSAKAIDVDLAGNLTVSAYKNYGSDYQLNVPIVDGKIRIDTADKYSIVYRAYDGSGNVSTKEIKVFGTNESKTISLEHNTSQFANMKTGVMNTFVLPSSFNSINTGAGYNANVLDELKLKIELASTNETIIIADLVGINEIEEFLTTQPTYRLSYSGEYKVNYYIADNAYDNYDAPISYTFNVAVSDNKVIYDEPFMYRHYIQGYKYDFDALKAYEFTTGKPNYAGNAELWISFDGKSYVKQASTFGVEITGSQTLKVKYVYADAVVETHEYPIVPVTFKTSTKAVSMGQYFVGDFNLPDKKLDGSNSSELYYISNTTSGNNTLQYIKPINIANFDISYKIEEGCDNFGGIKFTLTDIYDPAIQLSIYCYEAAGKYFVRYNDESSMQLSASFKGLDFAIAYSTETKLITVSNLAGYLNAPVQFTTDNAYLDIELCDISGTAGVTIKQLNVNQLKKQYYDRTAPTYVGVKPGGTFALGDIVTLSAALYEDDASIIIRENISFKASINGTYIRSVDGILLDGTQDPTRSYDVRVEELGKYSIQYTCKDTFNNKLAPTFSFVVKDYVAPEIKFSGSIKEDVIVYAKPGYEVKLNFTLSDNITPKDSLKFKIFVLNMYTASMYAVSEKSFKLNYEGTYEISVVCYDADENQTIKSFTVVISANGGK